MGKYKPLSLEEMKREASKSTQEKIQDLVREGDILSAQTLYFKDIMKKREGIIGL